MSNRLYFSVPNKFIDPYDNLIFANSAKIVGDILGRINTGMEDYFKKAKTNGMKWVQLMGFMWSHYADYHRGFILVFKKEDIKQAERFDESNNAINAKTFLSSVRYVEAQIDIV